MLSLQLDIKITFSLQYGKSLCVVCLSLVPKTIEILPKYAKTNINSLERNIKLRSFFTNNLFKNLLTILLILLIITRENNKCVTSVYTSLLKLLKKFTIETFLRKIFRLSCNYEKFCRENKTLKSVFKHIINPQNFVNQCINKYLYKYYLSKNTLISWFLEGRFVLSYLGKISLDLWARLRRTIDRVLPYCELKVIIRSNSGLHTLLWFKDSLEIKILSGIIYRYTCSNCKVTYYRKIFCHFYNRVADHMRISHRIRKRLKNVERSATSDHLLQCNCAINFDDFSILRKSLLIKLNKSILNRTIKLFILWLFDLMAVLFPMSHDCQFF